MKFEVYVESYARFIIDADSEEDAEQAYQNLSIEHVSSILYDNIGSPRIEKESFED